MTFSLCVFHLLVLISILPRNNCAAIVHDAGWVFKILIVYIIFGACFYVPIEFFQVWGEISRYTSIIFFILQVLYILVGAYSLGEYVVSGETASEAWRNGVLLIYTLLLSAAALAFIATSFIWFQGPAATSGSSGESGEALSCGSNVTLIVVTIIMFIIVFALRLREENSLLTAAIVNLWLAFLLWSALASQPDECNTLFDSSGATIFQILSHLIWTLLTLVSLSVANTADEGEKGTNQVAQLVAEDEEGEANPDNLEVEVQGETKKGSELFLFPVTV